MHVAESFHVEHIEITSKSAHFNAFSIFALPQCTLQRQEKKSYEKKKSNKGDLRLTMDVDFVVGTRSQLFFWNTFHHVMSYPATNHGGFGGICPLLPG